VDTSLEYLRRLSANAQKDPDLSVEVGNAYMRVARVQGVPISQNLGQLAQAEQNLKAAESFLQAGLAVQPGNRTAMLRMAQITHDRMRVARSTSRSNEALEWARKSAVWLEKLNAGIADNAESSSILVTYLNVADQHTSGRQYDEALRLCRRGTDLARTFSSKLYEGDFLWVSAEVFRRRGDLEEALKQTSESAKILDPGNGEPEHGRAMNFLLASTYQARILGEKNRVSLGRPEEALPLLERTFRTADEFVHQDSNDQSARGQLAMAGTTLADILRDTDPRRALDIYDHISRHMMEIKDNSSFLRFEVSALAGSSYALRRLGRDAEVPGRLDGAFERLRRVKAYPSEKVKPNSESDATLSALADYQAANGNVQGAIKIYTGLLESIVKWGPTPKTDLTDATAISRVYDALASLHRRAGEVELATGYDTRKQELWRHWDTTLPNNLYVRRKLYGTNGLGKGVELSENRGPQQ